MRRQLSGHDPQPLDSPVALPNDLADPSRGGRLCGLTPEKLVPQARPRSTALQLIAESTPTAAKRDVTVSAYHSQHDLYAFLLSLLTDD